MTELCDTKNFWYAAKFRHVLYWSHSCFNEVPKLILDVCTSLGGEAHIIIRFGHGSHNTELSWAIHFFKKEVICSCAPLMLITVWPVKSASNKSGDFVLFCTTCNKWYWREIQLWSALNVCWECILSMTLRNCVSVGLWKRPNFHDNFHRYPLPEIAQDNALQHQQPNNFVPFPKCQNILRCQGDYIIQE